MNDYAIGSIVTIKKVIPVEYKKDKYEYWRNTELAHISQYLEKTGTVIKIDSFAPHNITVELVDKNGKKTKTRFSAAELEPARACRA